jgi:hypothetical protein
MADLFDSAWLKWGRAVVHTQTLEGQVARDMADFNARKSYTSRTEYDSKRHCVIARLVSVEPLPPLIGLLIGDAANNFRACLDHLAWALVTTRPKRPLKAEERERVYFPLARSQTAFDSHLVSGQLLTDRDRSIIRRYQPFWHTVQSRPHPKNKIDLHCLLVMADVNREDKHRDIRPVWTAPQSGELYVGAITDCTITRIPTKARAVVLQPGAELHRVYVRRTGPNPDVYMEGKLGVEPLIDGRVTLWSWYTQTTAHIRDLLLRFSQPPKELLTLGIVPGGQRTTPQSGLASSFSTGKT